MKEFTILFAALTVWTIGTAVYFFVRGLKVKKEQKRLAQNRKFAEQRERFEKDRIQHLRENLSVHGVTKSSDYHKKYSGKRRYQKAPVNKNDLF